uniref:Ion_trans domain-containing protein n=1 Tax=Steinernema glaseri TaxID=37863 RepID=A0A1I7XZN2_9BILA
MVRKMVVALRIIAGISLLTLFTFHLVDFALECHEESENSTPAFASPPPVQVVNTTTVITGNGTQPTEPPSDGLTSTAPAKAEFCKRTWFNSQYRFGDYKTAKTVALPWWQDSLGIAIFVFNILFIAVSIFFVVNVFIGVFKDRIACFTKALFCAALFFFAVGIVITRGYANSPIGFIAAVLFMVDVVVYQE